MKYLISIPVVMMLLFQIGLLVYFINQIYYMIHSRRVGFVSSYLGWIGQGLDDCINDNIKNVSELKFVELGSGWGGISRYISKKFDFKEVIALELNWSNSLIAKFFGRVQGGNVKYLQGDIFKYKPPSKSIFYCYLFPSILEIMQRENYFQDCYVISLTFEFKNKEPVATYPVKGFQKILRLYHFD